MSLRPCPHGDGFLLIRFKFLIVLASRPHRKVVLSAIFENGLQSAKIWPRLLRVSVGTVNLLLFENDDTIAPSPSLDRKNRKQPHTQLWCITVLCLFNFVCLLRLVWFVLSARHVRDFIPMCYFLFCGSASFFLQLHMQVRHMYYSRLHPPFCSHLPISMLLLWCNVDAFFLYYCFSLKRMKLSHYNCFSCNITGQVNMLEAGSKCSLPYCDIP